MQESDVERSLEVFKKYIELERSRSELEVERDTKPIELGRVCLLCAKFCTANAGQIQKLTGVCDPYRRAARYAETAVTLLNTAENEIEYQVDACLEACTANWFIDAVPFEHSLAWCERALEKLTQKSLFAAVDESQYEILHFTGKKNRALLLHYVNRYAESIEQYRGLLKDPAVRNSDSEQFTLHLQLSNLLLDNNQLSEANQLLDECVNRSLAQTNDQKLRLASSRSLAFSQSGDMNRAIAEIHQALSQYYEFDESLSARGNLLLRAARFHLLVGDTEKALSLMSDIDYLNPKPGGGYFDLNKSSVEAMAAVQVDDVADMPQALTAFHEKLCNIEGDSASEYWIIYHTAMSDFTAKHSGAQAAITFLQTQTEISCSTTDSLDRESYPLLLSYCELAVCQPDLSAPLEPLVKLLLRGLGYADRWDRWRTLLLAARFAGVRGRYAIAIRWAKLACLAVSTLSAPLFSSAAQRRRLAESLIIPYEELEHYLVKDGQVPQAHIVRAARKRLQSLWRFPNLRQIEWHGNEPGANVVPLNEDELEEVKRWDISFVILTGKLHSGDSLNSALHGSEFSRLVDLWMSQVESKIQVGGGFQPGPSYGTHECRLDYWSSGKELMATVTTDDDSGGETVALDVDLAGLRSLVYQCRGQIVEGDEWKCSARTLYTHLIAPIEDKLVGDRELNIGTCDALRYLPFAALHDGQQFLIEKMPITYQQGGASIQQLDLRDAAVLFLGTTQHASEQPGLRAKEELSGIAESFPIRRSLTDGDLDRLSLAGALPLPRAPGIVHFCNHYDYMPHQPERSKLLLSDNRELSLPELFDQTLDWSNVGFLFLGVCNSGLSGMSEIREVAPMSNLSLADLFLSSGVMAVVATFNPVVDTDNIAFSKKLYEHLHVTGNVSRALRSTQIEAIKNGQNNWPSYGLWR